MQAELATNTPDPLFYACVHEDCPLCGVQVMVSQLGAPAPPTTALFLFHATIGNNFCNWGTDFSESTACDIGSTKDNHCLSSLACCSPLMCIVVGFCLYQWWFQCRAIDRMAVACKKEESGTPREAFWCCADYWQVPYPAPAGLPDCTDCLVSTPPIACFLLLHSHYISV